MIFVKLLHHLKAGLAWLFFPWCVNQDEDRMKRKNGKWLSFLFFACTNSKWLQNWFAWRDVFSPNIVFWGESFFQSVLKHSQPFYSIFNSKVSGWGGCSWVGNIQTCDCVDPLVPGERGTVMTGVWRRGVGAQCSTADLLGFLLEPHRDLGCFFNSPRKH